MILITGATGLAGRHIVPALLEAGCRVRCLARDTEKALSLLGEKPELYPGDVTNPASLPGACRDIETVVHLVAVIREKGAVTFDRVNAQGVRNVVDAAERSGCRRFIHLSALGAREDPAYRYAYSKWLGEEAVRRSGLAWTIFRPSVLYGSGFGFFDRMAQSLRTAPPPFAPVPAARTRFQPLAAADLARCVTLALKDPGSVGHIYEIGGPEQLTYGQKVGGSNLSRRAIVALQPQGLYGFIVCGRITLKAKSVPKVCQTYSNCANEDQRPGIKPGPFLCPFCRYFSSSGTPAQAYRP